MSSFGLTASLPSKKSRKGIIPKMTNMVKNENGFSYTDSGDNAVMCKVYQNFIIISIHENTIDSKSISEVEKLLY